MKYFERLDEYVFEFEVRRVMGVYLRNFALYDLQIAIDKQLQLSNFKKPNKRCDNSSISVMRFIISPEIAFTFNDPNGNSVQMFRLYDIPKYSSATLKWFLNRMNIVTVSSAN